MALNANLVQLGDETLVDLTGDTVAPETLMEGATAHDKAGNPIKGTASGPKPEQVKEITINKNGDFPITPDLGKVLSKVLAHVNVSDGGNIAIGRVSFASDRVISQADPLILTHNLGVVPNIMCLFISKNVRNNSGHHDFFVILANQNGPEISIKGSYMNGNYPEMYLYEAEGQLAGDWHSFRRAFMDVWGATENEIKIGAYRDVGAMLPGNTEYIWLVAKE